METLDSGLMDFFVGQRYSNGFPPPAIGLKSYQSFMGVGGEPWFASRAVPASNTQKERSFPTWARIALGIALAYFVAAYLILPRLWKQPCQCPTTRTKDEEDRTQTASLKPAEPALVQRISAG